MELRVEGFQLGDSGSRPLRVDDARTGNLGVLTSSLWGTLYKHNTGANSVDYSVLFSLEHKGLGVRVGPGPRDVGWACIHSGPALLQTPLNRIYVVRLSPKCRCYIQYIPEIARVVSTAVR